MNKFLFNFRKYSFYYLISLVLMPAFILGMTYVKNGIKKKEMFSLFVTTNALKSEELANIFYDNLKDYGINYVYMYDTSYNDEKYVSDLNMRGFNMSDLLVIPKCDLLSETLLTNDCSPFKTYDQGGINYNEQTYALNIAKAEEASFIKQYAYLEVNADYYLVINAHSYHYKSYIKNDQSVLSTAIDLLSKNI